MNGRRWLFALLFVLGLGAVVQFSFFSDATPLRREIAGTMPKPAAKWIWRNYGEVRHFPSYLFVTVLLQLAVRGTRRRTLFAAGGLLLLAAILEIGQSVVPSRSADLRDFLWSALGVLVGSLPWLRRTGAD